MTTQNPIKTNRLLLRSMTEADLDAMAAISGDPEVMRYFPSTQSKEDTQKLIQRIMTHQSKHGYSLYACELKSTGEMIGFVGLLHQTRDELDIAAMPGTEIGWRLSSKHWNQGYATEAAKAVLNHAFTTLGLDEVVSFTAEINKPSRRVMEKIGLQHNPKDDFLHPAIDKNNELSRHVLYRVSAVK